MIIHPAGIYYKRTLQIVTGDDYAFEGDIYLPAGLDVTADPIESYWLIAKADLDSADATAPLNRTLAVPVDLTLGEVLSYGLRQHVRIYIPASDTKKLKSDFKYYFAFRYATASGRQYTAELGLITAFKGLNK